MLRLRYIVPVLFAGLVGAVWMGTAFGQQGGPGGGGGYDPEAARQRMMGRIRENLRATEEEWKAIEPGVEAVQTLMRQARPGSVGRMFGRGGPPAGVPGAPEPTEVEKATEALQAVLDNPDSKPEEIAPVLKAYRDAREKAREELAKAQDELRKVVTPNQEARLVLLGLLE